MVEKKKFSHQNMKISKKPRYSSNVAKTMESEKELPNNLSYQAIYNQSIDGLIVIDLQKNILYINESGEKLIGKPLSKIKKVNFSRFLGWTSRKRFSKAVDDVKSGKTVSVVDLNMLGQRSNLHPVEILFSPLREPKKPISKILLNVRDVAEKKKAIDAAHEQEKMQALQHFISGEAQEIHHPIKALLDQSQRLVKKYSKRQFEYISFHEFEDIMNSLDKMRDQIRYCHETTKRMISLNKRQIGRAKAHVRINPLIEQKILTVKHQFEITDIIFSFRKGRNLKMAAISEQNLDQIMQNILTNSVQSMPAGGKIQIKTLMDKEGNNVIIECRHSGVGIPDDVISRIFEPFFTTKHRGLEQNSGLGLSIVYSIVKSYRGKISIKSTLRKGTIVTVSFPVYHNLRKKN